MSLFKQLWLAIAFLVGLSFIGSFAVSSWTAKNYLEEQLSLKNIDNANSLALSLSSGENDPVVIELTIAAQFDSGHYRYIRLEDPQGAALVERNSEATTAGVPDWFTRLLPITPQPGIAQVSGGWNQIGTITLESHKRFAYHELWSNTLRLGSYFFIVTLLAGILGSLLLKVINRPLLATVKQAQAIGDRQFITMTEPKTLEFRALTRAMNQLSERVKNMLEQESGRLEQWRRNTQVDITTGLFNRDHYLKLLATTLDRDDATATGTLVLVRLCELQTLNRLHGRQVMDLVLSRFGDELNALNETHNNWTAGKLNGGDFVLTAPGTDNPGKLAKNIQQRLLAVVQELTLSHAIVLPIAVARYQPEETVSELLRRLDSALASAEQEGKTAVVEANQLPVDISPNSSDHWQQLLMSAFERQHFILRRFPVMNFNGKPLHEESPLALQAADQPLLSASQFMPWINRLQMVTALDQRVLELALKQVSEGGRQVSINLSSQTLTEANLTERWLEQLKQQAVDAQHLCIEIPEYIAYRHLERFRYFCRQAKALGCHIGIKQVGHAIDRIGELHDLGLDYIKIDAALVIDINQSQAHQVLLRGLAMIAHSIGLLAIAEGVTNDNEWKALQELGLDGATGPAVTARYPDEA